MNNISSTIWVVTGAAGQVGSHVVHQLLLQATQRREKQQQQSTTTNDENTTTTIIAQVRPCGAKLMLPRIDNQQQDVDSQKVLQVVECDLTNDEDLKGFLQQVEDTMSHGDETTKEEVDGSRRHQELCLIHCAGMTAVNACYEHPDAAHVVNVGVTEKLAKWVIGLRKQKRTGEKAAAAAAVMVYCSTDMVFDGSLQHGDRGSEYWYKAGHEEESDELSTPNPLSIYGKSKLAGEKTALAAAEPNNTNTSSSPSIVAVARLPLMYGVALSTKFMQSTFVAQLNSLCSQSTSTNVAAENSTRVVKAFDDEWRTPVSFQTAALSLTRIGQLHLAGHHHLRNQRHQSIYHIAGSERLSRLDMLKRMQVALRSYKPPTPSRSQEVGAVAVAGHQSPHSLFLDTQSTQHHVVLLEGNSRTSVRFPEPRPADLSMMATIGDDVVSVVGSTCGEVMSVVELHEIFDAFHTLAGR